MSHIFVHPGCTDGEVRLAGGLTPYYGRVELCQNGVWGTVCGGGITDNHIAEIVCNNLNIEYHGSFIETWSLLKYFPRCKDVAKLWWRDWAHSKGWG